jgi:hypothetical protein
MSGRSAALDTSVTHPARRYDYWLGGKDNFAAGRRSGDQIAAAFPDIITAVRENRRFLRRVVTYLAAECGIRQFLDIGTGLPTADNTHEVAQRWRPSLLFHCTRSKLSSTFARSDFNSTGASANTPRISRRVARR